MKHKKLLIVAVIFLAVAFALTFAKTTFAPGGIFKQTKTEDLPVATFNKQRLSTSDPASLWVVVNKNRTLEPVDYFPADLVTPNVPLRGSANSDEMKLRKEPAEALERMVNAAKTKGASLKIASGYRSYRTQITIYNNEVRQYGKAVADTQSARPGHSEHQTGLAVDLQDVAGKCVVADCFKDLAEGKWLGEHAWEYGFIVRYPLGKDTITGYRYEPWHLRYVGAELATEMHNNGMQTLEEFFNLVQTQPY